VYFYWFDAGRVLLM